MVPHCVTVAADAVAAPYVVEAGRRIGVAVSIDERPPLSLPEEAWLVIAARSASGQGVAYPLARVEAEGGRWRESVVGDGVGVAEAGLAELSRRETIGLVTMVYTPSGELVDMAAGPGIEGLWTLDATLVNHCENQVRASLDLPLGAPQLLAAHVASRAARAGVVTDPTSALLHCYARDPRLRAHFPAVGPPAVVTAMGRDATDVRRRVRHATDYLEGADA